MNNINKLFYIEPESLNLLSNQGLDYDIILAIDNSPFRFVAFKHLIKLKSNLFREIFQHQPNLNYYNLVNCSREAVITWLRHIYNKKVIITSETFIQVSLIANRYQCDELMQTCHKLTFEKINWKNALFFLNQYLKLSPTNEINQYKHLSIIKEHCLTTIDKYGIIAILRPSLFRCDNKTICEFIKRDSLRVHEWTLFTVLLLWVQNKCRDDNVILSKNTFRNFLGDAFYQIRFPLMRVNELVTINDSGLALTNKEYNDILSFLLDIPRPVIPFSNHLRENIGQYVDRFSSIKMIKISSYPQEIHQIDISVNRKIRFIGVGIFLPKFNHLSIGRNIIIFQLWDNKKKERILTINRRMIHGTMVDRNIYPLVFTSCIYLEPGVRYGLLLGLRYTNWRANYRELVVTSGKLASSTLIAKNGRQEVKFKIKTSNHRLEPFYNIKNGSNSKSGQFPRLFYDFE